MTNFEKELWAAQPALLAYASVLCGSPQEAEDIVGEANLALIRRRDEYDPSRGFLPWARSFVYYQMKCWRTKQARSRLVFGDGLVDRLAEEVGADPVRPEDEGERSLRADLLEEARRELTPEMRYLLARRYSYGDSIAAIARQLGRTADSVAVSLFYLRNVLRKSVEKKLKEREHGKD